MHLGNGQVTTACALYGLSAAGAGLICGYAVARKTAAPQPLRYALGTSVVFALQALNLPVASGISGHLIGGMLLAYWFGPAWGTFAVASVLALQSALVGDGGWTTLGCNIFNMAVIPCLIVYPIWDRATSRLRDNARLATLAVASWISVLAASVFGAVELLSTPAARDNAQAIVSGMVGAHALIGLIEAVGTVALIIIAQQLRDLPQSIQRPAATAGILAAALLAAFGSSPWPDGLDYALSRAGVVSAFAQAGGDYTLVNLACGMLLIGIMTFAASHAFRSRSAI
ncbi:MAG TPA: energy-coupling factor ABC transporter permease [Tepidisphaeraceae bacterium]|jgi:cobalt/nickel transport system permease protein